MTVRSGVRRADGEVMGVAGASPLERARQAAAELRWLDAHEGLRGLDRRSVLAPGDLELLATAAYLRGSGQESQQVLLRAYQLHVSSGDARRAVRCAARLGLERLSAGEVAEAAGCLPVSLSTCSALVDQGRALLAGEPESAEHGYLLIPVAYEQLASHDDLDAAAGTAAQAVRLGRRFGDTDLLALALSVQGRALVRRRRVHEGMVSLDESVTLAVAADVSPSVAGLALTAALDASLEAFELQRSDEWTLVLSRWCDRQQGLVAFRSRSLAYLAAFHRRHGRWDEAVEVAEAACRPPAVDLDTLAGAVARQEQGEVLRRRGQRRSAEAAFRLAGAWGADPQPGLALLRLADGDAVAAAAAIDRALGETTGELARARLLPARAEVSMAVGDLAAAARAAAELERVAARHGIPALDASAAQAKGEVLLAEGDARAALASARQARRVWRHFRMPDEEARALVLSARCCRLLADEVTAMLELDAACDILAGLGAEPDLLEARSLRQRPADAPGGLTRRELEVLGLVATGLTNRAIAERLVVTTRTVDTHVSSILAKLGVPTRAAATAHAHRHHLV